MLLYYDYTLKILINQGDFDIQNSSYTSRVCTIYKAMISVICTSGRRADRAADQVGRNRE